MSVKKDSLVILCISYLYLILKIHNDHIISMFESYSSTSSIAIMIITTSRICCRRGRWLIDVLSGYIISISFKGNCSTLRLIRMGSRGGIGVAWVIVINHILILVIHSVVLIISMVRVMITIIIFIRPIFMRNTINIRFSITSINKI